MIFFHLCKYEHIRQGIQDNASTGAVHMLVTYLRCAHVNLIVFERYRGIYANASQK